MRKLLLPILFTALAIFSFFWYTEPAFSELQDLRAEIDEYDTALQQVSEIQQVRDQLLARSNQISENNLYLLNQILPPELDQVRLVIALNQIAAANGLAVQGVSFLEPEAEEEGGANEAYKSAEVTFSTSGSYDDVLAFMRDIEQSARLSDIIRLNISDPSASDSGGSSDTGTLITGAQNVYNFTVLTYWLPSKAPLSATGQPEDQAETANNDSQL
jgi:Tfp pilus assembly protein PilO